MASASSVIAWAKKYIGSSAYSGMCQAFVADAYAKGGGTTRVYTGTATNAWKMYGVSSSKTNIPVGAAVYFNGTNSSVGHVGIYIGNGQVIHAYPTIMISNLNSIPGYRGWGWNGNFQLTGSTLSDQQNKNINGSSSGSGSSSSGSSSGSKGSSSSGSSLTVEGTEEKIQVFHAQDKGHIEQWGLLRYFEEIDNPSIGQNKANKLLELYNRKSRELTIQNAFGDPKVRAGCLIPVQLDLGDVITNNYMLVEKVTHRFTHDTHFMDLTLDGAWED